MLLSEKPPPWLGIIAKSSLVSERVREESSCEVKIACFCNKVLSSSSLTYTLGFSRDGVRDNLTHCVHLKRELELLLGFDSIPSIWRCVVYLCLCYVLILFVSGGWYSSCSDTRLLFTRHKFYFFKICNNFHIHEVIIYKIAFSLECVSIRKKIISPLLVL